MHPRSTGASAMGSILVRRIHGFVRSRLLENPGGQPSQVLYLDFRALDDIFRSMLYNDDPAKRRDREKGQPEQQTKIAHAVIMSFQFRVLPSGC